MSFVYPQFLWALLFVAIPVIVHLFNFRRIRKVYFSNVRLLQAVKTETNAIRTLREWLILAMRIGFVVALVLAFAQPFLPSSTSNAGMQANSLVSIYVDNSFSMQSELDGTSALDQVRETVSELLKVFPASTNFQLITNDFANAEQFPLNAQKLEDRLAALQYSNKYRDLQSVYNRQYNLLKRASEQPTGNQIFWFSDFQKSTAGDLAKLRLDSLQKHYIVPVQSPAPQNIAIDSVWLENPFLKANETNRLNFSLRNWSNESYEDFVLKLIINDIQVSTATVQLSAQAQVQGEFNFTIDGKGFQKARISFEDFPVSFDNEYYFVLNVAPAIRILHIYEEARHRYIESVYASEGTFKTIHSSLRSLDYTQIANAELIVLNELPSVEGELKNQLTEFVKRGGSLLVFPSEKPDLNSYTSFLSTLGLRGLQAAKDSLGRNPANTLRPPALQQPFFAGVFEQIPQNLLMPYASAAFSWLPSGYTLLSYRDGRPFASQSSFGKGKVYLFAAPLQEKYSDFAVNALFVPIMYRVAALSKASGERLAYSFQEKSLALRLENLPQNEILRLRRDNTELIPAQRQVGEELRLELPEQALEAGYYALQAPSGEAPVALLAFNYAKEESDIQNYGREELKGFFADKKHVQLYERFRDKAFIADFQERNIGKSLWKQALVLALLFALAEILIIRFLK
jgi:hypothetical protein